MRRAWIVGVVVLAACGGGNTTSGGETSLPSCASMFSEGATITRTQLDAGCTENGKPKKFVTVACKDGRRGAQNGNAWVFADGTAHVSPGRPIDDPSYKAAEQDCYTR